MLGQVEIKQPIQGIPIASLVYPHSPLEWSSENVLALATQVGTYIFELKLLPDGVHPGVLFERSYILPPTDPHPSILVGMKLQSLVKKLDNKSKYSLMLDSILTSAHRANFDLPMKTQTTQSVGGESNHSGYSQARWSFPGMAEKDRCILCLVTYSHQLYIIVKRGIRWERVIDLTTIWASYSNLGQGESMCQQYINSIGNKEHQKFMGKTRFLSILDILWTPLIQTLKEAFSYLLMITGSGHLVTWKISSYKNDLILFEVEVFACNYLSIGTVHSGTSHWFHINNQEGFLITGGVNGDLDIFHIFFINDGATVNFLGTVKQFYKDNLTVNCIELKHIHKEEDLYILLVAKHNILFSLLVKLSPESFEIVSVAHMFMGCLSISALNFVTESLVYVCTKDGDIQEINIEVDESHRTVNLSASRMVMSAEGVIYNDCVVSPNKIFWAVLESVSLPYDHLVMREPTVISIFQVNQVNTIMQHLETSEFKILSQRADLFEAIRLFLVKNGTIPLPPNNKEEICLMTPQNRKVLLWLTKAHLSNSNECRREELTDLKMSLEESICCDWFEEALRIKTKAKSSCLDGDLQNSLALMFKFLALTGVRIKTVNKFKNQQFSQEFEERCLMCGDNVNLGQLSVANCSKGHSLPRCFWTLLPTMPINKCELCNIFYHPNAAKWFGDICKVCIVCGRSLTMKSHVGARVCHPTPVPATPVKKRRDK